MQQIRKTILSETELHASKPRFALFNQPPPLAVGDDSPFRTKQPLKGQDGKPITQPRNFVTSPPKLGKIKSSYFQPSSSIYQGDLYVDPHTRSLSQQNINYRMGKIHENEWKPSSGFKTIANAAFKYMQQRPPTPKKIVKDENGKIATEMRNIQTNSCSKIESTLLKKPKYMSDPFNRKMDLEKEFNKKMMMKRGEETFVTMSCGGKKFNKDSEIYGTNVKFPEKRKDTFLYNIFKHQAEFRPTNISHGPFNKYPEHKAQSPLLNASKKSLDPNPEKKEPFIPSRSYLSRPTPSVTLNPVNLRRSMK